MASALGIIMIIFVTLNVSNHVLAQGVSNGVGHDEDSGTTTYDKASLDYSMDVCRFVEITPTCRADYVFTAATIQRLGPGNCGCFRQDMEMFLYEKCLGANSCKLGYADLKVDTNIYAPPPTEFCWFNYRIIYTCQPAMSLCQGDITYASTKIFPSNVNLISPEYPLSYPGTPEVRPQLVCGTEISISKPEDAAPNFDSGITISHTDLSLPMYQFVALCGGNILHVGVSQDKLGPDMWDNCVGSDIRFSIETSLHIFYHYNYDFSHHRGVILKIQANNHNAMIRVKYVNSLEPTSSSASSTTRVPPEMFNVPGKKKNNPIHPHPDEYYNSTAGENPTEQDLFKGSLLVILIALSAAVLLLIILMVLLCVWRRRYNSWKAAAEGTTCCICCKPSQTIAPKESVRLSTRPGSMINPYACSELFPMNGAEGYYENEYKDPARYVNTRDEPGRCSTKIQSAIYDEIDGQVKNVYETHIPTCSGTSEEHDNSKNESNAGNNTTKRKEPFTQSERKKSDDDGYDSNSTTSMALQEGETLLVENDLYDSK